MRFTQQLRYSLCGVFDLAYHRDEGPVRIEEIGRRQSIPARYLEQIFQKLRRAGLVVSKRGPGGGYLLARPPEDITLADVILAVQGEVVRRDDREPRAPATVAAPASAKRAASRASGVRDTAARLDRAATSGSAAAQVAATAHETGAEASLEFISDLVEQRIVAALQGETIAGLCREATRRGIPRAAIAPLMFEI